MTALALPSMEDIRQYARGALSAADALDVTPTPLHAVTEAVNLLPAEDLYEMGNDVPPGLLRALRKLRGKVAGAFALAERTVYVDMSLPYERKRFTHAHEIGHGVLPWHTGAYLGDDEHTLHPDTRDELEREANAFAAELLFGLDRFTEQADAYRPGLAVPLKLAEDFHTSAHAAIRRYVERSERVLGLLVLGRYPVTVGGRRALKVLPDLGTQSVAFLTRYGVVSDLVPGKLPVADYPAVTSAASALRRQTGQPVTTTELVVEESRRGAVRFDADVFSNGRFAFVLLHRRTLLTTGRRLRAVATPA